ncbi:MAG: ATP-binding protein [Chloroflexota bacterium]|nr:ATP-binding protein [Chloroflexota bacterium]
MITNVTLATVQTTKQDQRLSTIFEIARILATQKELDTMLSEFLACLVETLEAVETGLMLLYDHSDGRLAVRAAQGYDLAPLNQLRLIPGEATCGRAFQTGEAQLYSTPKAIAAARKNLTPANREAVEVARVGQRQLQSAVCIPLFTGETKEGVLRLENRQQPDSFVHEDIPFLKAVADLIALSIENARLREELHVTQSLEEANRLKAELISTLAHEMRTPLTSIKGYSTALLMDEIAFSPETQQEFLQIIDEECTVLQDLIHDLLESSIIDAGLLRLEPQPVMLHRLAQGVTNDMERRTQKHSFVIDFERRPDGFPIVDADPRRVEQVLRNLLDNAIKYSPQGGLVVVRGQVNEDENEVVISVADQGVGIAPEHLNRLFEKFFRVESGMGRHVVGSGLGLPIARTIVESHGGRIWAESQVGEGSTLYFTLPLEGLSSELAKQEEE